MPFAKFGAALLCSTAVSLAVPAYAGGAIIELDGGIAQGEGVGRVGVMLPFILDSGDTFFTDVRGVAGEDSELQGSFGAGYRHQLDGGWVVGAYSYWDVIRTERDNTFHQLSFGAEAFGLMFEARANVYLPLSDEEQISDLARAFVDGDQLAIQSGREWARASVDGEAGVRMPVFPGNVDAQFKLLGGGYWREGDGRDETVGVKARSEISFAGLPGLSTDTTLTLGAAASYDDDDKLELGVLARLRVPFGGTAKRENAFDPMLARVERAELIDTEVDGNGRREAAEFVSTGERVGTVVQLNNQSGAAETINATLAAAGERALVLGDGTVLLDDTLALGDRQLLLGGGGEIAVQGASSGVVTTFRNGGERTVLVGLDPLRDVVSMGSDSEIASLSVRGGYAGVSSQGTSDLRIRDVEITAVGRDGIRLEDVQGATIERADIHDLVICQNNTDCEFSVYDPNSAPYAAISALGTSGLSVRDTRIANVTYGIFAGSRIDDEVYPPGLVSTASNITIDNVEISNSRREGILLVAANDVSMNKVTIDNSEQGLDMDLVVLQGTSDVTITDMSLAGGINGLLMVSASTLPTVTTNVSVDDLDIRDTRNAGIFLNPVSDISFRNVSITNAGSYGVFMYGSDYDFLGGPVKDISFENTTIDNAATAGLYFLGPAVNVSGDVSTTDTPRSCLVSSYGPYVGGSLTQEDGSQLMLDGEELNEANLEDRCL